MDKFRYSVRYHRDTVRSRVIRVTVTASSADEARDLARLADPHFDHTVASPKRGARVVSA